jgi:hypothetical protein
MDWIKFLLNVLLILGCLYSLFGAHYKALEEGKRRKLPPESLEMSNLYKEIGRKYAFIFFLCYVLYCVLENLATAEK